MTDEATMTLTVDGVTTAPFTLDDLKAATGALKGAGRMKADPDFASAEATAYSATARELRAFVERYERLEEEKKDIAAQQKEVLAEAKCRGYDVKVLKKLIALRKRDPQEVSEEESILDLYKTALGM